MMIHIISETRLVSQYLSLVNIWWGMRIAHRQLGARIVIGQEERVFLPRTCTLSWVMVWRNSHFKCMHALMGDGWAEFSLYMHGPMGHGYAMLSGLGYGQAISLRPWIVWVLTPRACMGEGLFFRAWTGAEQSPSRPAWGLDHPALWDRTISPCVRCALIEPGIALHVHSLCGPRIGLFM